MSAQNIKMQIAIAKAKAAAAIAAAAASSSSATEKTNIGQAAAASAEASSSSPPPSTISIKVKKPIASGAGGDDTISPTSLMASLKEKEIEREMEMKSSRNMPKRKIEWIYPMNSLNTDFSTLDAKKGDTLWCAVYRVNTLLTIPFLEYLMLKFGRDLPETQKSFVNTLIFPKTNYKATASPLEEIQTVFNKIIGTVYSVDIKPAEISPRGYLKTGLGYTFIYEIPFVFDREPPLMLEDNKYWWCIIDEIVNYRSSLYFPIHDSATSLFLKVPELCYILSSESGNALEIPTTGYHGTSYDIAPLIAAHGLLPSKRAMMGPYYYFGTFRKSVRYAGWTSDYKERYDSDGKTLLADKEGKYIKAGGIIKFIVFLGKTRVILNHPLDPEDRSAIYKERILTLTVPALKTHEDSILRMHDHDGKWAKEFDSVYVGRGTVVSNPEWVVKSTEQFVASARFVLDESSLSGDWKAEYDLYLIKSSKNIDSKTTLTASNRVISAKTIAAEASSMDIISSFESIETFATPFTTEMETYLKGFDPSPLSKYIYTRFIQKVDKEEMRGHPKKVVSTVLFKLASGDYKSFEKYINGIKHWMHNIENFMPAGYVLRIYIDDSITTDKTIYDKIKKSMETYRNRLEVVEYFAPAFRSKIHKVGHKSVFGTIVRFLPIFEPESASEISEVAIRDLDVFEFRTGKFLTHWKTFDENPEYRTLIYITDYFPAHLTKIGKIPIIERIKMFIGAGTVAFKDKYPISLLDTFLEDSLNPRSEMNKKYIFPSLAIHEERKKGNREDNIFYGFDEFFVNIELIEHVDDKSTLYVKFYPTIKSLLYLLNIPEEKRMEFDTITSSLLAENRINDLNEYLRNIVKSRGDSIPRRMREFLLDYDHNYNYYNVFL